jgi:2-hydroxy-6-oxo-6-(2'-carboxyphenyl)-hexa-2,4-dienoate hydrolase
MKAGGPAVDNLCIFRVNARSALFLSSVFCILLNGGNPMNFTDRKFPDRFVMTLSILLVVILGTAYLAAADVGQSMGGSKFIDVDGIRTRYFEGGSGEPVVLVHGGHYGMSGGAVGFMPVFPELAEHFHVYAVDKLGMGLTDNPKEDSGYSMQATTQHIYQFMKTLGLENVHLVGHSRGGLPVARIAMDHPELIKTLTLFDSNTLAPGDPKPSTSNLSPPGPPPTRESIREGLMSSRNTYHKDYVTDEYVEAQLEVALHPKIRQAAEQLDRLRKRFIERNPEKVEARPALANNSGTGWWLYEIKDSTLEMLNAGQLKTPTLVIWGYNDPSATHEMASDLFQVISKSVDQAQLHFFNQCGHSPYHEYPQEVTNIMVNFTANVKN